MEEHKNTMDLSLSTSGGLPMDGRLPDLQCAVCHARGHGCHFGVVACRPCAAFFRRCIAENRSYKCLRGTNNCDIRRDGQRNACKSCRLRLCRHVGMVYNASSNSGEKEDMGEGNNGELNSEDRAQQDLTLGGNGSTSSTSLHPRLELQLEDGTTPTLAQFLRANNAFIVGQRSLFMALHPEATFQSLPLLVPKHIEFVRMEQGTKPLLFAMLNDGIEPFAQMEHQMKLVGCLCAFADLPTRLLSDHGPFPGPGRHSLCDGRWAHAGQSALGPMVIGMGHGHGKPGRIHQFGQRVKKPLMEKWFVFIDSFRRFSVKVGQQDFCALTVITLWNIAHMKFGFLEEGWRAHKEAVLSEWLANLGARSAADPGTHWSPALQMSRLLCQLVELNSVTTSLEEAATIFRIFQPNIHNKCNGIEK